MSNATIHPEMMKIIRDAQKSLLEPDEVLPGAKECLMPKCTKMSKYDDVPLCDSHERKFEEERSRVFFAAHSDMFKKQRAELKRQRQLKSSVVYYVAFGDQVKIGTTTNLKRRLGHLYVHDLTRLLAIEPGGLEREHERHLQFADSRTKRTELFDRTPELDELIAQAREMFGDPTALL